MNEQHKYRKELQNRSMMPSEGSWDQLSEKMDAHENIRKGNNWTFLKYAAVILVLISVGFYFFKPTEEVINTPIIVTPSLKEDFKNIPEINKEPEVRVATAPINANKKEAPKSKTVIYTKNKNIESEALALGETKEQSQTSKTTNIGTTMVVMPTEENLVIEESIASQNIDAEVERLLNASKIKLTINGQISLKRVISANALLDEVEDDLDKDFKEKLFEKIVKTVKTPRKVVITDRGN